MIKPTLTTAIRNGQLEHVLHVAGETYATSFTSRAAAMCALAFALELAGCATCEKHATACWVATGIAAGCIAASTNHRSASPDHIPTPSVDCSGGQCK